MIKNRPNELLDLVTAGLLLTFFGVIVAVLAVGCVVIGWQVGRLILTVLGLLA